MHFYNVKDVNIVVLGTNGITLWKFVTILKLIFMKYYTALQKYAVLNTQIWCV